MASYRLAEAIDAARITGCHGHGEHHWLLVVDDGRTVIVSHDWVRDHQPVVAGDWFLFTATSGVDPGFPVTDKVFSRLFSLPLKKIA